MAVLMACISCKNFNAKESMALKKYVCSAFPLGIPFEIVRGFDGHREPFEGDNGIKWEPKPGFHHLDTPRKIEEFDGLTSASLSEDEDEAIA